MKRISNWPTALVTFLAEKDSAPFVWGENDCCMFTADWLAIVTGNYPAVAAELRGTYISDLGAARILKERGGVEAIMSEVALANGWGEIAPCFAQRGDVATVDSEHGPAIGVVIGSQVAYAGKFGAVRMPLDAARKAWRIG